MPNPIAYQGIVGDNTSPVGGVPQIIDPLGAGRVSIRGLDYSGPSSQTAGGHFRVNLKTGATTGVTAGQPIASLRWTDTAHYFALLGIKAWANINTAFGTAQLVDLEAFVARGFTASDSGGTAITPISGNNQKMRSTGGTAMSASLLADLRIATTGALTAGTRTLDAAGFAIAQFNNSNALGNCAEVEMYKVENADHPLVLAANEGIVFQVPTAQGLTGKVVYYIALKWGEVLAF